MNLYLLFVLAAVTLALAVAFLCWPTARRITIRPWAAVGLAGCVLALGLYFAITQASGQRPEVSPGQPRPVGELLAALRPGTKAPRLEAQGWLNGLPPSIKDKKVRLIVVDVWAAW